MKYLSCRLQRLFDVRDIGKSGHINTDEYDAVCVLPAWIDKKKIQITKKSANEENEEDDVGSIRLSTDFGTGVQISKDFFIEICDENGWETAKEQLFENGIVKVLNTKKNLIF